MIPARSISRFALYGEGNGAIAPEFVHIEPISRRSSVYEWTIAPHSHPGISQWLLLEVGTGQLAMDDDEVALAPGALVALPNGCVHAFRFAPDAEGWVLSLAVDLLNDPRIAYVGGSGGLSTLRPRWVQLGEMACGRLSWLLADLARVLSGDRSGLLPDAAAAQIALVLAMAKDHMAKDHMAKDHMAKDHMAGAGRGHTREALVGRFRGLVELHFRDGWSVADYADALGATAPTLTRNCRQALGRAPAHVVLDRILLEAMRSLTYSQASVSLIAEDLGFADTAYFARFFKLRSGMTASTFRRERGWLAGAMALPWQGQSD